MTNQTTTPEYAISRRRFLISASLATTALGFEPLAGMAAPARENPVRTGAPGKLCLWYDRPAKAWMTEALPIGNGPMGAMLFGGTEVERIQFNEISLWAGTRMAVEGLDDEGQDLGAYQAFGDILIHLGHDFLKVTHYRQALDIERAVHQVTYEYNGVRYQRTAFASHPDGVIVIHLTANKLAAYTGRVQLADMHQARIAADGKQLTSVGKLKNGFEYEAQLRVLNKNGAIAVKHDDACAKNPWNVAVPAASLAFDQCDSVILILGAGTNFLQDHTKQWLGAHPHAAVTKRVDAAARQSAAKLLARHEKDYQSLFRRFSLDVGTTAPDLAAKTTLARLEDYAGNRTADPDLEALFCQFGRYLLISCSRPGSLPANLQGVWNDSNQPAWAGDYHSNINVEMNYWPAEPANLAECHRPFIDYVSSIREVSAKNTRRKYGPVRGWTVQTMNNACGVSYWKWNPPGSAWYAQHLWEHFAFGRDKTYLRQTAYPVLKEVCQFWDDHLKRWPDGTLVTPDGWSPEHGPAEEGVTYDQEIIYDLFTNTIEAADVLGDDQEFRAHLVGLRDKLLKPKIGRWGQLQEWEADKDNPKDDHRHVSHLFALYPGRQITRATTPELAEAARVSLQARGDKSTGWSRAWKINFWARLWNGDHAYTMLRSLLNVVRETKTIYGESGAGVYPNLFDSHPPFQIDGNFGATAGYCEMLMQSHAGRIHLLPALPTAWPTGKVTGLCARGGFEVEMSWKDDCLIKAAIHSKAGLPCKVVCGDQSWEFDTKAGKSYPLKLASKVNPKPAAAAGFTPIFNGKDLIGWDGKPGWWKVEDGALIAESTPDKPCKECNYLIWRGGQPANFELITDFRLSGAGNSGIQLRSQALPNWDTSGYQADMSGDGALVGFVYEHTRGLIAGRGERVTIGSDGKREAAKLGDAAELGKIYRKEAWNTYRIICRGPEITLYINGTLMCQFTDRDAKQAASKGIIALQMHPGPPMKIEFKNIRLKQL